MAKKKIESATDFKLKTLDFIEFCQSQEVAPTDFRLWDFLGVSPSEWDHLSKGRDKAGKAWPHKVVDDEDRKRREEEDRREADDAIKKLTAYREDRLVQQLETSKVASTNAIFQLKQPKNGGYQDVQQADHTASVTIKIDGIGGLDSFK